jgi:hypothetical protein
MSYQFYKKCKMCGNSLALKSSQAIFCSHKCAQKAVEQRPKRKAKRKKYMQKYYQEVLKEKRRKSS